MRQLKRAIEHAGISQLDDALAPASEPLRPRFGLPYTYRVLSDPLDVVIDLGATCPDRLAAVSS